MAPLTRLSASRLQNSSAYESAVLMRSQFLLWCLRNNYTFVALKLAWGEARGRECIPSDTRPTEQRSPRPISAQPEGRHVFWAEALLLAPYRSTSGYARRSRLASAQNPLPRMYSYFGDTTLARKFHTPYLWPPSAGSGPFSRLTRATACAALSGMFPSKFFGVLFRL